MATKQDELEGASTNDLNGLTSSFAEVAKQSRELLSRFYASELDLGRSDPANITQSFMELTARMMTQPAKLVSAQMHLWQDYYKLWHNTALRFFGQNTGPVIEPEKGDRRFKHPDWEENPLFDYIKQSYLLTANWMKETVADVEGLDVQTARKVDFYTGQFVDALSPSNFALTNPEVLKETLETRGQNLIKGLQNVLEDLKEGEGQLRIRMTDESAFEVGVNVATAPGKIVYQNELMQLIQYAPTTEQVYKRPLLIIPPWINKYYILDLTPEKSFIRWAVDKGYTVFVVSWVNPNEELSHKRFDDYMLQGILAALDAVEQATGEREVSAIGYCIGGTLLAATLAYMAAKKDDRVKAATFFAAQVDFSEPGELEVFIDEEQLNAVEARMSEKGYLEGSSMASAFNMLRANDLIWSFVVNNYLMGKDPYPFDLLYWNGDATRMPVAMHSFYLKEMYLHNNLVKPGAIILDGVPIDLSKVDIPVYLQASKEDHIAPYPSVFKAVHHFSGPVRFMMAGSGHIAGVINPPAAKKYKHWTNNSATNTLDEWLAGAEEHPGSWWPDWHRWLSRKSGAKVPAGKPGDGKLKPIEDAPGSYVKVKS